MTQPVDTDAGGSHSQRTAGREDCCARSRFVSDPVPASATKQALACLMRAEQSLLPPTRRSSFRM